MPAPQLALFRLRDFRSLFAAVVLNSVGMMGENVVLGWLTLELTNSPLMVGVALGMRMLPLFFVGVPAGALADRFPRHRLLLATGAAQAATAAVIGALTLQGRVTLTQILVLTFVAGTVRAVEHAARQSYTHDVVGGAALVNGFAVLGVAMRAGWLAGSLGTGYLIARLGIGWAYMLVAAGFLLGGLLLVRASAPAPAVSGDPGSLARGVVEFFAAMRTDRTLLILMVLTAAAEILGFSHQVLLPSLARDVMKTGPEGLGVLNAARSIGGILGLIVASLRGPIQGGGALFLTILLAFGVSLMGLALAPFLVGFAGVVMMVVLVNAVGALADLFAQSLLQLSVPRHLRGRAGGAWVVAIGLAPLGQMQIGALASAFGVSIGFAASGLALVLLAIATAVFAPRARRL
ncbi:MAG TPA: MFS transporter [Methylomirabilota bacterium]|nr:MFS transporter [Methylomirabilota bacterium]